MNPVNTLQQALSTWAIFSTLFTELIVAVIILLSGIILARITGKVTKRALHELELNGALRQTLNRNIPAEEMVSWLVTSFIYLVFFIIALDKIGLNTFVLNVLAIVILFVVFLSIILAIYETLPNASAGIILHISHSIRKGDLVAVENISGKVTGINLIETKIETEKGDIFLVNNSILTKRVVCIKKSDAL